MITRVRASRDEGSILPLVAFFAALALTVILLVVAATSLYLARERLFTVADGAALAGAEAFDLSDVTAAGGGLQASLDSGDVADAVHDYLALAVPEGRFEELRVERADSTDGTSARVTLSAYWRPPVVSLLVPEGIRLEVTSTARAVFG